MKKHAKDLAVESEVRDCAAKNKIMFSQHSVKRMGERRIDSAALMNSLKSSELINVETRENAINDKEPRYTLRCFVGDNIVDVVLAKNNWANDYPFVLVTTFMENREVAESINGKPSPAKPYSWAKKKQVMTSKRKYRANYCDDDEYQLSCELALYD